MKILIIWKHRYLGPGCTYSAESKCQKSILQNICSVIKLTLISKAILLGRINVSIYAVMAKYTFIPIQLHLQLKAIFLPLWLSQSLGERQRRELDIFDMILFIARDCDKLITSAKLLAHSFWVQALPPDHTNLFPHLLYVFWGETPLIIYELAFAQVFCTVFWLLFFQLSWPIKKFNYLFCSPQTKKA